MNSPRVSACPLLLIAHPDPCYTARTFAAFRRLGWDVHTAVSAPEVRRLARKLLPTAIVLSSELTGESGWLICDKLVRQQPELRIFLVDANPTGRARRFARFVGAEDLLSETDDVGMRVEEALGIPA